MEADSSPTPAFITSPGRREGISEAARQLLAAAGPPVLSESQERPEEAQDAINHTVQLLQDLESICGLVRSKNLARYGDGPGYRHLAGAFLEAAADFPEGWTRDDVAEAVRQIIPGLREPSWGLILLAAKKGESTEKEYQFRDRLVGKVKEATMHRQRIETKEAAQRDPAWQAGEWLARGHVLLSQVARDNPSLRSKV